MNSILAGMQLVAIYSPDFEICASHDLISIIHDKEMSQEDIDQMKKLGWVWDGEGWSHHV